MTGEPNKMVLAKIVADRGNEALAEDLRNGEYNEWDGERTTPIVDLVAALTAADMIDLADRVREGEFDDEDLGDD
jgi:hypothetical protein